MYKRGLIVGKFCPLHKGHEFLISQAQSQCEQLYILSYTQPEFSGCEPSKRRNWLAEASSNAKILVLQAAASIPDNDASDQTHRSFTAQICRENWGMCPDAIFTSENYGDGFAEHLSREFGREVTHICVDLSRERVPISATLIRQDIHASQQYLSPNVYASFVETVCFLGAESTGKSSLSRALVRQYSTSHVEEYGRTLWMEKNGKLDFQDYMKIARTHTRMEDEARLTAHRYVFIDTSPLTTLFYALDQFSKADQLLIDMSYRDYDRIFLCYPDFPMVQDGWRSDETFRRNQHDWYIKNLSERGISYTCLKGTFNDKIEAVKSRLRQTKAK